MPHGSNVATLGRMLSGYAYALQRLDEAIKADNSDASFRGLFECLNWAAAIDDRIQQRWAPEGVPLERSWRERAEGAAVMAGVRFARNRVQHQWADAIFFDLSKGRTYPKTYPVRYGQWCWRALSDLPAGRDNHGSDVYCDCLAEQPVMRGLLELGLAFERVGQLLEPARSVGRHA
jgi:hypothetical protein